MTKIYVGNLPFSATDAEIRELFAAHGTVESVSIITDRDTGRPRGFGFVEMSRAMRRRRSRVSMARSGGRPLRVNEAQERTGGGGNRAAARRSAGKRQGCQGPVVRACKGIRDRPFSLCEERIGVISHGQSDPRTAAARSTRLVRQVAPQGSGEEKKKAAKAAKR